MQEEINNFVRPGDRLREERKRIGLNQAEMGELGNVTKMTQLRYEQNESAPTITYLEAVAKAGVDVQYVVTGQRTTGGVMAADESELLRRYRAAPKEVRRSTQAALSPWANHNGDQED